MTSPHLAIAHAVSMAYRLGDASDFFVRLAGTIQARECASKVGGTEQWKDSVWRLYSEIVKSL
tara:strand:- start:688 stop:876 length:189 start_codon:yes stop_codon:yes gene_type:complete